MVEIDYHLTSTMSQRVGT